MWKRAPEWLKWLGVPLLIGIITTVGAIVGPFVLDQTLNASKLAYAITSSPPLQTSDGSTRIFVYRVTNEGARSIHDLRGEIDVYNGTIAQFSITDSSGVRPLISKTSSTQISISAATLLSKDEFSISLLVLNGSQDEPAFYVRSNEAKGTLASSSAEKKDEQKSDPLSSGIAAAIVALIMWTFLRDRPTNNTNEDYTRREHLAFLAARSGLMRWQDVFAAKDALTYRTFADIMFLEAVRSPAVAKSALAARMGVYICTNSPGSQRTILDTIMRDQNFQETDKADLKAFLLEKVKQRQDFKQLMTEIDEKVLPLNTAS